MKITPISHKNENTFKFQTFSERISNINVDVIHRIGKTTELPEDADTFFLETLVKWTDLNYTEDFDALKKEIGYDVQSLAQLVYRQDEIAATLERHLSNPKSMCLDAAFDLLVALARDLQMDFYPSFPRFFKLLVSLLSLPDTVILEQVFTTLAYLFKFMWRCMIKDIQDVYQLYSSLFASNYKEHIRNFAAESFAFLMRKVPDKEQLFLMIFMKLRENPEQASGVGQLLFEIIKGVKKQLHSSTENVLTLLLKMAGPAMGFNSGLDYQLLLEAQTQTITALCGHVTKEFCSVVLKVFCNTLTALRDLKLKNPEDDLPDQHLLNVQKILKTFVGYKSASLVEKPSNLIQICGSILSVGNWSEESIKALLNTVSTILCSYNISIDVDILVSFISKVFKGSLKPFLVLEFSENLFQYKRFDTNVLSKLLEFCQGYLQLKEDPKLVLSHLARLVIFKNQPLSSAESIEVHRSLLLCSSKNLSLMKMETFEQDKISNPLSELILENLSINLECDLLESISGLWAALICVPHLGDSFDVDIFEVVENLIKQLCHNLKADDLTNSKFWQRQAYLLAHAISALAQMNPKRLCPSVVTVELLTDILKLCPLSTGILCSLDIYLTFCPKDEPLYLKEQLASVLIPNLCSPYHKIRLLTLRILSSFSYFLRKSDQNENENELNVFEICLSIEKVDATIQDIRQKLMLLQKLNYNQVQKYLPVGLTYEKAPLYYLLGILYINFQLIWPPVQQHLCSYAKGFKNQFWPIFYAHLQESAIACEQELQSNEVNLETSFLYEETNLLFEEQLNQFCQHKDTPDIIKHRQMLWKVLENAPEVAEVKNRDVVTLYLRFLINEYTIVDTSHCPTEDISTSSKKFVEANSNPRSVKNSTKRKGKKCKGAKKVLKKAKDIVEKASAASEDILKVDNSFQLQNEVETNEDLDDEVLAPKRKANSRTLAAHLAVFSKFQNPRAIYKEPEVYKLHLELLTHKDEKVQSLAFDCLTTYNHKFLSPYIDNFKNLLDDKTFKTEIVLFSIDSEHGVIQQEHRSQLLPLLMSILYGKMLRKTGSKTSGKSNSMLRRSIVLRFLAGCTVPEIKIFLDLAFGPFAKVLGSSELNLHDKVKSLKKNLDPTVVVPIRRQLSILSTLGIVFDQLGNLISSLLPWLLDVLLCLATSASTLMQQRSHVHPSVIGPIKNLRIQSVYKLIQFFQTFDMYPYSKIEVDAIFEASVWTMLPKLEQESLSYPTPLLKMLAVWSEIPRLFPLLGKYYPENISLSPVSCILDLFNNDRIQHVVVVVVSKILENLLSMADPKEDDESGASLVEVNYQSVLVNANANLDGDKPNYGTMLLVPHVSKILKRLKILVERTVANPKKVLSYIELNILSRISEYVTDETDSSSLLNLLIMFLNRTTRRNQDIEYSTLVCIRNLMRICKDPNQFIRPLAPLFATLHQRRSRTALCQVLSVIAKRDSDKANLESVVLKMNAWNPKLLEEPDYNSRLDGFNMANNAINAMAELDCDYILTVIFNCTFFVETSEDMSLQDNASFSLQQMAPKLASISESDPAAFQLIVLDILLEEIRKGLKSKVENVRHEFIQVLSSILNYCGKHPRLVNLAQLSDQDKDVDFWVNITHMQIHRRARALRRVAKGISNCTLNLHYHVLSGYLLPLANSFVFEPSYAKHSNLIDVAIEVIGAVCSCFPWDRYEALLKYYLGLLGKNNEFHKIIIKIVVAILNNFHFDLSNSVNFPSKLKAPEAIEETQDESREIDLPMDEIKDIAPTPDEKDSPNRIIKLSSEKATKIFKNISQYILPRLHSSLAQKTRQDDEHKLSSNVKFAEDNEILLVPIAFAMIKLLQNLPHNMLKHNLPGIFLRVVNFLKSRSEDIRETARETLIKMMKTLGPLYFWYLLKEMKGILKRGYQVHVMIFTVHSVLFNIADVIKPGDLDSCIHDITELCKEELFGEMAEEKEVDKIKNKLKEAKSTKSFQLCNIMARFVSETHLPALVTPFNIVLATTHSHKSVTKINNCLKQIGMGLTLNQSLSVKSLLIFAHGIISISAWEMNKKKQPVTETKSKAESSDIYIIPSEPKRGRVVVKTSFKTNAHVLTDFSLRILHFCLKKERLVQTNQEHLELLDPYIPILTECLRGQHVKVISTSLRCLCWLLKFPLPSLKEQIKSVISSIFILLNKYSGAGIGQGENFEMVVMCFKTITVIVRDIGYHKISEEQLKVLLVYIEQDIFDHTRQSTAFTLAKAILSKKLRSPDLPPILKKIAEMSVSSEQDHVRSQCRQVYLQYLLEYPLGRFFAKHLTFFVVQLEYEFESGRESTVEMLSMMFSTFPTSTLNKNAGLFMIPLSARLVNDPSPKIRQNVSKALKSLLSKIDDKERNKLFKVILVWLENKNLSHKRIAVQMCGIFAEVEKTRFVSRLNILLPLYESVLLPEQYQTLASERTLDHLIFHILNSLIKIFNSCGYLEVTNANQNAVAKIWDYIKDMLLHPHSWVRLASSQLFGLMFSFHPVEVVLEAALDKSKRKKAGVFFAKNPRLKLQELSANFCTQLRGTELTETHSEQIVRNLIYLAKVIRRIPTFENPSESNVPYLDAEDLTEDPEEEDKTDNATKISFNWMLQKLCREAKYEVSKDAKNTIKRNCVFKWFAAISLDYESSELKELLPKILPILSRELTDNTPREDDSLKGLAQEVADLLKNLVGIEYFSREWIVAQKGLATKRSKRKAERAIEAVSHPEISARKKIKKNLAKIEQRKRKFEVQTSRIIKKKK